MHIKRVVLIILDGLGIGALPDADKYGDEGSDTLRHIVAGAGGLKIPGLTKMGLANIEGVTCLTPANKTVASYGRMMERSPGKDTTTGHWEIAGLVLEKPFPVYPDGFPPDIIKAFEKAVGRRVLGNKTASGTAIIDELGVEHTKSGRPIVYTSADSVFQIAAHEEIIPVEELYRMCRIAREILTGEHAVGRVIARPFTGRPGSFKRTERRHDFSLAPFKPTILDFLKQNGYVVQGVGKIKDIFAGRGITKAVHTVSNTDGVNKTLECMNTVDKGLIFVNLVDFDTLYGHRNDVRGYAAALEEFDRRLPEITGALQRDDLLIITADHGCDPATPSTDHSREYVPLLVYGRRVRAGINLGTRSTFADVAATLAELFNVPFDTGTGFAGMIMVD